MSRMRFSGLFAAATFAAVVGCNSTTPTQTNSSWPEFESEDTTYASRIVNADSNKLARGTSPGASTASYETLPTTGSVPGVPAAPAARGAGYTPIAPAAPSRSAAQAAPGGIEFVDPSAAPAAPAHAAPAAPAAPARTVTPAPSRSAAPATRTASAPAPAARAAGAGRYVVKKGDTLWDISKARYGTALKWKQIAAANPTVNPNKLPVGKAIVIP